MATVRIHIDDEPIDVEAGTNLLIALLDAGHALPHPCFHPALSAPASCRLCLVALEGPDSTRLITACNRNVELFQIRGRKGCLGSAQRHSIARRLIGQSSIVRGLHQSNVPHFPAQFWNLNLDDGAGKQ